MRHGLGVILSFWDIYKPNKPSLINLAKRVTFFCLCPNLYNLYCMKVAYHVIFLLSLLFCQVGFSVRGQGYAFKGIVGEPFMYSA